jgi:hypothetical protein
VFFFILEYTESCRILISRDTSLGAIEMKSNLNVGLSKYVLACFACLLIPAVLPAAHAASTETVTKLPVTKKISATILDKYKQASMTMDWDGTKTTYTGVPLRTILAEMLPEVKMNEMPEIKALSRRELVLEVKGDDGFPGLVTVTEIAMNKSGDRFLLATHENGKPIEKGVHLICKMDELHVRSVRQIVSIKVFSVAEK